MYFNPNSSVKLLISYFFSLFISLFSFSCDFTTSTSQEITNSSKEKKEFYSGKVIGIKDGDTYEILIENKSINVRLAHIDCPEKKQDFGNRAKQFSSDLCFGKMVSIKKLSTDRYKRWIVEVYLEDGTCVNEELVRAGFAWHFKKYSKNEAYDLLEKEARENARGLWQMPNPTPPWEWRENRKKK